jgi:hypothetical protein
MRSEFLFEFNKRLVSLNTLRHEMDRIVQKRVTDDLAFMDRRFVEVYDMRQREESKKSLGKMSVSTVFAKFR